MAADAQRVWQARSGLLYRSLVDGGMIYDGESGRVHHLNDAAAQIWELCQGGATSAALAEALCRRYAVEEPRARADVEQVLRRFAEARLLQP
jgi:PqqD family protein of HPr-rel-A system